MHDLPTSNQILEELADKTAAQIERRATVAFDSAWREMTGYHRFLLAINSSETSGGDPFSFAEVAGYSWSLPHNHWIRHYRRLFERAADRIPDETHFIRTMAYAPIALLPRQGDPALTPGILNTIIDLGSMMVHRLQAWVTKRTVVEPVEGHPAEPRMKLAGSDAKAYQDVLPEIIGAWESLLQRAPALFKWERNSEIRTDELWESYRRSWPFLWQHLSNTAYCLAVAVWNEDNAGASYYRDSLLRWPRAFDYLFERGGDLGVNVGRSAEYLQKDWPAVSAELVEGWPEYLPKPSPSSVFSSILGSAHEDVLLLSAALFLFWSLEKKQLTDIGAKSSLAIFLGVEEDPADSRPHLRKGIHFSSAFKKALDLEGNNDPFAKGSHPANLDKLVETLDRMTERRVVPGRIYTPSTLHGRDELTPSLAAILAFAVQETGENNVSATVQRFAERVHTSPRHDAALRQALRKLDGFSSVLKENQEAVISGIRLLQSEANPESAIAKLVGVIDTSREVIQSERTRALRERSVSRKTLEELRSAVETGLLTGEKIPFFRSFQIKCSDQDDRVESLSLRVDNIGKAHLVDPPMDEPILGFEDWLVSSVQSRAGKNVWRQFTLKSRTESTIQHPIQSKAFWLELKQLAEKVGIEPSLIVSRSAELAALRKFVYRPVEDTLGLRIERRTDLSNKDGYVATIEGIDVFGADFESGNAWLFSGQLLGTVEYLALNDKAHYVEIEFDADEAVKGKLVFDFRQKLQWKETPIFEVSFSDPADSESES